MGRAERGSLWVRRSRDQSEQRGGRDTNQEGTGESRKGHARTLAAGAGSHEREEKRRSVAGAGRAGPEMTRALWIERFQP